MIVGVVSADREATLHLVVHGLNGQEHAIEAIIDTGFTGFLTLPPALILSLGLPWRGQAQATLGDGSVHQFDVYVATVMWDGQAASWRQTLPTPLRLSAWGCSTAMTCESKWWKVVRLPSRLCCISSDGSASFFHICIRQTYD